MDKDDDEQAEASSSFPDVLITEKDRGSVRRLHEDPVVIECKVANQLVGQILIDTGSYFDNSSYKCLSKLDSLRDVSYPIVGFGGGVVHLAGKIDLPIWLGE